MSTHSIDESTIPGQTPSSELTSSAWRGALIGLVPLGLLIGIVVVSLLLTALAHQIFAASGFFAQQQASVIVLIVGLVLAVAVYAVATWRVLRRVGIWQQERAAIQARAALWVLAVTALVVVVPVLLALLLPQHPAP